MTTISKRNEIVAKGKISSDTLAGETESVRRLRMLSPPQRDVGASDRSGALDLAPRPFRLAGSCSCSAKQRPSGATASAGARSKAPLMCCAGDNIKGRATASPKPRWPSDESGPASEHSCACQCMNWLPCHFCVVRLIYADIVINVGLILESYV